MVKPVNFERCKLNLLQLLQVLHVLCKRWTSFTILFIKFHTSCTFLRNTYRKFDYGRRVDYWDNCAVVPVICFFPKCSSQKYCLISFSLVHCVSRVPHLGNQVEPRTSIYSSTWHQSLSTSLTLHMLSFQNGMAHQSIWTIPLTAFAYPNRGTFILFTMT